MLSSLETGPRLAALCANCRRQQLQRGAEVFGQESVLQDWLGGGSFVLFLLRLLLPLAPIFLDESFLMLALPEIEPHLIKT